MASTQEETTVAAVPTPSTPRSGMGALASLLLQRLSSSAGSRTSSCRSRVFCRICHEDGKGPEDTEEPLISPCHCSGSVGLIHKSCLEKWLTINRQDNNGGAAAAAHCELCGFEFNVEKRSRPCSQWLLGKHLSDDQRNIIGDLICFLLLTPLAAISAYLCVKGSSVYNEQGYYPNEATGLLFLAAFLLFVYFLWLGLTLRFHCLAWREWRNRNQDIQLVEVGSRK